PRTLAQIGLAEQALGRWVIAETHVARALEATADPWIAKHRTALDGALAIIRQHLGSLEVVADVSGAEILVDGRAVGTLPLRAPLRLVAGSATLEVRAAGYQPVVRPLLIPAGGLARESVELTPRALATAPPVAAPAPEKISTPMPLRKKLGFIGLGASVLLA